ncbi:MAG: glycosyltransferase family 4 protein [Tissierellia bacterium]|nr:glycosyltransferase family 4 protein [Tissierellia bacterium]
MKRIWIINHYAEPPSRGKYLRHFYFAKKLISRGYDVKIFTASTIHNTEVNNTDGISPYIQKNIEGVDFIFVRTSDYFGNGKARVKNILDYYFGVQKAVKDFGEVDVVYSSGPHPLSWLAAKKIAKRKNSKLIIETRDLWPETFVAMGTMKKYNPIAIFLYALEKNIYKAADRLIFTFPGGSEYIEKIGLDSSKVAYVNNGIDLNEFNEKKKNIYEIEEYNNFRGFKAVFTGAIGRANNIESIVKAAEILKSRDNPNIKIFIFGYGTEEEKLKKYVKDNDLDNIKFMGRVDKKYIPDILSKSDLNILTLGHMPELFKYGLSPNKLFEYFASGKPTISNVECGYDLLEKYGSGITVESEDPEKFADGILKFYNMSVDEYDKYCKNALKAAADFDFEILTDRLIEIIEN